MQSDPRLIAALDFPTAEAAKQAVEEIGDAVIYYKVGMELSYAAGNEMIRFLKATVCLIIAAILGILTNTTTLYANYKYSKDTTTEEGVEKEKKQEERERDQNDAWAESRP